MFGQPSINSFSININTYLTSVNWLIVFLSNMYLHIDLKDIMELYCNVNHLFEVGGLTGERRASQV